MTPKIWNKVSFFIEAHEKTLIIIGLVALVIFLFVIVGTISGIIELSFLMFLPIIIVFYCCGFGLTRKLFKTEIENEHESIDHYMESASILKKGMMWYASLFLVMWFSGLTVMLCVVIKSLIF
jgi:hypothetical protein